MNRNSCVNVSVSAFSPSVPVAWSPRRSSLRDKSEEAKNRNEAKFLR